MFKAKDTSTGIDVIILDQRDDAGLDDLRDRSHADLLRCPVCNQPVSVKAGEIKVWHFAHKHLADCPSQSESAELLEARAMLYDWLKSKFVEGVTIEKTVESSRLPRHVDCWVEAPSGINVAYWIFDRQIRGSEDRHILNDELSKAGSVTNYVFISSLMRRNGKPKDVLNLNTTERSFIRLSDYDIGHVAGRSSRSGSLHYLDNANRSLITFRAMGCVEYPQEYSGHEVCTLLEHVRVRPSTGEFVHPGEAEQLQALKAQAKPRSPFDHRSDQGDGSLSNAKHDAIQSPNPFSEEREGVCEICGKRTRDWWMFDGAKGTCRCNECRQQGKSSPATASS